MKSFSYLEKLKIPWRNRASESMPDFIMGQLSLRNTKVFFSLPMPSVISACSVRLRLWNLRIPTQSKISLMMSDGLGSFFSSFRSLGRMLSTARSASSTKGCAWARSASASAFSCPMASASRSQPSLITATASASFFASMLDTSSLLSMALVAASAWVSLTSSWASATFMCSTSSAPWRRFSRPTCTRCCFCPTSSSFFLYSAW
mmetsp:Transcript_8124/g.12343  ORF Transcript_8124/g.12343 Transcript_8124/m.12343 type:complete len:204 (-) Transcript_8124:304-915(-)